MGINWSALATVAQELVAVIDTGKYGHLTLQQVGEQIEKGGVLAWLAETAKGDVDLSVFLQTQTYENFVPEYEAALLDIWSAYSDQGRRKWGIENSGLCLMLTWTIEILKQRIRDARQGVFDPDDF